jgi:hypothetical protein
LQDIDEGCNTNRGVVATDNSGTGAFSKELGARVAETISL